MDKSPPNERQETVEQMKKSLQSVVLWDEPAPRAPRVVIDIVDKFDARGMRRVYGRSDRRGFGPTLSLDIWQSKNGRILVRFSSRANDVDELSFEIFGYNPTPTKAPGMIGLDERWVPKQLREEFNNWVLSEMRFL